MKHLLSILTIALLGAAVTASANPYYYDYYLPSNVNIQPKAGPGNENTVSGQTTYNDTVTYHTFTAPDESGVSTGISETNSYTIYRESNWDTELRVSDPNNFFRIEIGHNNDEKIRLYLTDYVSALYGSDPVYHSDSNALFNDTDAKNAIVEYGYRKLSLNEEGKYVAGETKSFSTVIEQEDGTIQLAGLDEGGNEVTKNYILNSANVTAKDTLNSVTRYQYDLGTFNPDDVIELYMKDNFGREVYSFSSLSGTDEETGKNVYTPFDNQVPSVSTATQGGYGEGGWVSGATGIGTDKMLYSYYFINPETNRDYHDYEPYLKEGELESSDPIKIAAQRALPLSQLIPGTFEGKAVTFGLYGVASGIAPDDGNDNGGGTFGSPLPGGLQFALIAGFFGLGLCYVRRRKTIVG